MLPISIRLKGIYSYQQEQHIDFSQLTESKLFGIFGAVGSGKSTILEAITLALYDQTERLNKNDNRKYNLMNLKSKELKIEFVFTGGRDDKKYRFVVQGKRNSKKFDDIRTFDRLAYVWDEPQNDWIPIDQTAEDILDLSYENFRRTIIIPQGKFQEFLQLKRSKRSEMLEEIFQLSKFDLQGQSKTLEDQNKMAVKELEGRLSGLDGVSKEILDQRIKEQLVLVEELSKKEAEVNKIAKVLAVQNELQKSFGELKKTKVGLLQYEEHKAEFVEKRAQLQTYRLCQETFKEDINRIKDLETEKERLEKECKKLDEQRKQLKTQNEEGQKIQKELQEKYGEKEYLQKKIEDLGNIYKICKLKKQSEQKALNYTKVKTVFDTFCNGKLKQTEEAIVKAEQNIAFQKKELPDSQSLHKKRSWFDVYESLIEQQAVLDRENEELQGSLKKAPEMKLKIYQKWGLNKWFSDDYQTLGIKDLMKSLEEERKQTEEKQNELRVKEVELSTHIKLEEFAKQLTDGKACPLCGSLHHPDAFEGINAKEKLTKLKVQQNNLQQKIQCINDSLTDFHNLVTTYKNKCKEIKKHGVKVEEAQKTVANHEKQFSWNGYSIHKDKDFLKEKLKKQGAQLELVEKEEAALKKMQTEQKTLWKKKEIYHAEVLTAEKERDSVSTELRVIQNNLKELKWEEFENKDTTEVRDFAKELQQVLKKLESSESQLTANKDLLKENDGQTKERFKQFQQKTVELQERNKQLENNIAKSDFENVTAVLDILKLNIDTEKEQTRIQNFFQKYDALQETKAELEEKLKGKTYDQEYHQSVQMDAKQLTSAQDQYKRDLGAKKNEIEKLQKALEQKESYIKELERLQTKSENIRTLKNMFAAKGFVNFVSTLQLNQLCQAANERFKKLTYNHLSLELSKDNSFMVRDFMNGGELRHVKTLSGGQTFQASLCLAIALADIVNKQKGEKSDFFFLDEGFGALDKDSLQIVFTALQTLRSEKKIVGVISHVEELKEEIGCYLKVTNGESGSSVVGSWE